jgi:two-component system, chemotaxis family, protein-glutamate methylesterase/glutaminase
MSTRVLITDDSPFVCRLLANHLRASGEIDVIGYAHTGEKAIELNETLRPDVITLDLEMPGIGGLAALEEIVRRRPVPVILLSGVSRAAAASTVRGLELGAVDFILKYTPGTNTNPDALKDQLVGMVRLAAGVKIIRSLPPADANGRSTRYAFGKPTAELICTPAPSVGISPMAGVVVIGASTGGPSAIREVLAELSTDFPPAVVIVQHMPALFTKALAEQLDRHTPLMVKEAVQGDRLRPGFALVAPGDTHLEIRSDGRVDIKNGAKVGGHRPSVDVTMASAAVVYGRRASGVLLTGMGGDGANGLLHIRNAGGRTFAQNAETCAVFGMPLRAIELHAAEVVDTPSGIGTRLLELAKNNQRSAVRW